MDGVKISLTSQKSALRVLAFLVCAPALAQEQWQGQLLEAPRTPTGTLSVFLPAAVTDERVQWLGLELDGVDISQLVQLESAPDGRVVVVTPPEALAEGAHELRLIEYSSEGDIFERGAWTVTIATATTPAKVSAGFHANASLSVIQRVADNDLPDLPGGTQGQGSANLQAAMQRDNWELTANMDLLYDSRGVLLQSDGGEQDTATSARGDDRDLELGSYLVTGRTQNLSALVGHHALTQQSLLMRNFHRRGISINAATPGQVLAASGFAFRTEPVSGFQYGLGMSNQEHRVAGALTTVRPLSQRPNALALTASYLRGEGQDQVGIGISGDDLSSGGDGWSVIAESRTLGNKLQVRAEFAETDFDLDGDGGGFERTVDDARALLVQYSPWLGTAIKGQPATWNVGVEYQQVGLFFRSLANPTLPSDKEFVRGYTDMQWGGFGMQAQVGREQDNVDDDPLLPKLENDLASVAINYAPQPETDAAGNPQVPWYGQANFGITSQYAHQDHVRMPDNFLGFPVDFRTVYTQATAAFQYPSWYWSTGYGFGKETDATGNSNARRNELIEFTTGWQPNQWLQLTGQWQYNRAEDQVTLDNTRTWVFNLGAQAAIIPGKLSASANVNLNQDDSSNNIVKTDIRTYSFDVNWQLLPAKNTRPGLALFLRGEVQEIRDRINPGNDRTPYQVFAGATISWSPTQQWR